MRYSFKSDLTNEEKRISQNASKVLSASGTTYKGSVNQGKVDPLIISTPSESKNLPSVAPVSRLSSAIDRANQSYANSLPTASGVNRTNNVIKGVASSTAASFPLLAETTKQSISDWQNKVKAQGLRSAMDDYTYNLDNPSYTFGKPIDKDSKAYQNYAKSQAYYAKALEGLTPAQQKAGQLGISMLESASTLPTAFINPSAPLVLMGAKSAAGKAYDLTNQGKTATEAAGRGYLTGVIEAATEKIPLENLIKVAKTGGKSAVKNILQQMGTEGTEELTSYIMNYAADVSAGDKTAHFSPAEAAQNFVGGAISGGVMGGLGSAIGNHTDSRMDSYKNNVPDNMKNAENLQVQSNIDEQSDNVGNQAITTKEFKDVYENENDLIPVERGLSQTDVNAYNFIKKNADNKNTSTNKIYNAYKKGRETLLKSVIDENFEAMKSYSPQGTQLIYSDSYVPDGYGQDVPSGSVQRISNNELWYSEAFKEYGHKPNQSQLKQFIEKKVMNDIKNGGGEYISPEEARKMRLFDSLLEGYNKVTENGKNTNIIKIHKNEKGNFEVDYSNDIQSDTVQPATQMQQNNTSNLGIVNPDVQALFNAASETKGKAKTAYQSAVSGWAPFERMSKIDTNSTRNIAARVNKYAQKGGITDTILTRGLYDNNGNKVSDKSFISIASKVPKTDVPAFNDYLQNLHNIDRQAQGKPVNANTADQSRNIVAQYEIQHPEFKQYRQALTDYWDEFMKVWYIDRGLISPDDYSKMKEMYPNYIPTFRVEDGGSGGSGTVNAGRKIIGGKAIGKAKGGTAQVVSFEEAFAKKIQSAISAASKNDISREIYEFAKSMPSEAAKNGVLLNENTNNQNNANIGDIDEAVDVIDKNIAREISKDNFEITFYENGKAKTMKVNRDVYEAYRFLDSKLGDNRAINGIAKLGRFFTNPMRAMTTTYNPLFFMTNIIRDIQTYAINNTAQNSAIAAKNYVKAIAGMAKQAETYNQYKALGGSQNGYIGTDMYKNTAKRFNPNKTTLQKVLSIPKAPLTAMEILGDVTEVVPRYAEYLNTIDTLGNTEAGRLQASLNAADVTVNFNRSSTASTLANAWIPYFNAGLQGMDKTFRQIKAHPVKTTTRAAVSVFLPTILLYLVNKDNPHWKDVKDGVRDNYYLIPNMSGPIDLQGNAETFIRLPKSREYGALMSASFERFMRALDDEYTDASDAFEGYGQTLLNSFMPPDLNDWIGGTAKAIKNNKAWHGGTIVPSNLTKVSPQYQYDINTSGAAMELAKLGQRLPIPGELGQALSSPMKADYWLDSYTGYAGDILQGLTSQRNKGNTPGETLSNSLYSGIVQPFKNRLTTDSAYSSYTLDNFYNKSDEAEIAKNDRNYADNLPSDYVTVEEAIDSAYTKAQSKISDLTKQEKAILASPMPIGEKNKQIRELRQRKNEIAKEMMGYPQQLTEAYNSVYLPAVESVSGIPDYNRMGEEDKNKVMTQITKYASDVAKSRIYPNSYYQDYTAPTYLPKVEEVQRKGVDLGDALFYKYKLDSISSEGGNIKDKRAYIEGNSYLMPNEKSILDNAFISENDNIDYTNHETATLTQMSDAAQRKWDRFESMGLSIDDYVQVYKAATSGTKNERLANLQALGYNYSEALQLYKAATKK